MVATPEVTILHGEHANRDGRRIGVRSDKVAHSSFRSVLWLISVLPEQQQTQHDAPDRCDDGEVTGKLGRGTIVISGINAWYGQESHVGDQQHSSLSKRST
jgi:hypothetical protein